MTPQSAAEALEAIENALEIPHLRAVAGQRAEDRACENDDAAGAGEVCVHVCETIEDYCDPCLWCALLGSIEEAAPHLPTLRAAVEERDDKIRVINRVAEAMHWHGGDHGLSVVEFAEKLRQELDGTGSQLEFWKGESIANEDDASRLRSSLNATDATIAALRSENRELREALEGLMGWGSLARLLHPVVAQSIAEDGSWEDARAALTRSPEGGE